MYKRQRLPRPVLRRSTAGSWVHPQATPSGACAAEAGRQSQTPLTGSGTKSFQCTCLCVLGGIQNPNPLRDQELGGPRENTISWHMPYARRNWCFTPSRCRANSRLRTMVITLNKRLAGIQGSLPPDLDQETFRFRADRPGVGFRVLFEIKFRRPTL